MKEFISKNIFNIITATSIFVLFIGSIIVNLNLNQFGIIDYDILKAKSIYVGVIFFFINFLFIYLWFADINFIDFSKNRNIDLVLNFIKKPVIFLSFFSLVVNPAGSCKTLMIDVFFANIPLNFFTIFIMYSSCFFIYYIVFNLFNKSFIVRNLVIGKIIIALHYTILTLALISIFTLMRNNSDFCYFSLYWFGLSIFILLFIYIPRIINFEKVNENEINSVKSNFDKIVKLNSHIFSLVMSFLMILLTIIFFYSKCVYTYLPEILGGTNKKIVKIMNNDKKIHRGIIIYSNSSFIYFKDSISLKTFKKEDITIFN